MAKFEEYLLFFEVVIVVVLFFVGLDKSLIIRFSKILLNECESAVEGSRFLLYGIDFKPSLIVIKRDLE